MRRIRIIPVLLLREGGLYKTIRFKEATYVGDPINTVKLFNEKEADEIILLDYEASVRGRGIDFLKIAEIAGEAFMPLAYGGGIASFGDAVRVFDAGFEKIVLNSALFSKPDLVEQIAQVYGSQAVVASVDVGRNIFGKYRVYSHSGRKKTGLDPVAWSVELGRRGVGEIMVNAIDRDGTWDGYDVELIKEVSGAVPVPVIACGGAGGMQDFGAAVEAGASAVAAGSLFVFQKKGKGVLISFPSQGLTI